MGWASPLVVASLDKDLPVCLRGPPTQYFLFSFSWFWVLPKRNPSVCWGRGGAVLGVPLINLVSSLWELSWRTDKGSVFHFHFADLYLISVSRVAQVPSLALRTFSLYPAFPEWISHLSVGPEGDLRKWLLLKILKPSFLSPPCLFPTLTGSFAPSLRAFLGLLLGFSLPAYIQLSRWSLCLTNYSFFSYCPVSNLLLLSSPPVSCFW